MFLWIQECGNLCLCERDNDEEEVVDLKESKELHGSFWRYEKGKQKSYYHNLKSNNNCNRNFFKQ